MASDDAKLREHRWEIVSRPNRGPALWRLGRRGEVVTQEEALRRVERWEKKHPKKAG